MLFSKEDINLRSLNFSICCLKDFFDRYNHKDVICIVDVFSLDSFFFDATDLTLDECDIFVISVFPCAKIVKQSGNIYFIYLEKK